MAEYSVAGRTGPRTRTMTSFRDTSGTKNSYINRMLEGGGIGALSSNEQFSVKQMLSPDEYAKYALGRSDAPAAGTGTGGASGTPGGTIDANSLMELYQKGLGAGASQGASTDDQIRLMREANQLDLSRKRSEQDMQMEGQKQALSQTQEARAKERETEAQLQRRQQSTERDNAMSAFKGL